MRNGDPVLVETCYDVITKVGDALLARAQAADAVRPDIAITQLLKLVGAIAPATVQDVDGPAEAGLLLAGRPRRTGVGRAPHTRRPTRPDPAVLVARPPSAGR
ncbi:hypothetical protein ACFW9M_19195 [Streptomyces lydicus]|uniref:SbtR family transcriptional regulator n=1 Tax=Streptomyces lydicus TaxID=47763 RepID=UPI0036A0D32C